MKRRTRPDGRRRFKMMIHTYRYGSPRKDGEGLRIGSARFLPRGVRREDWQKNGYFDLWLPLLAPEPEFIKKFLAGQMTFAVFARHYRARMKQPECRQVIELLAGVSLFLPISLGCYCEEEARCHRSLLRERIAAEAEKKRPGFAALDALRGSAELRKFSSPVCFADWDDESAPGEGSE
jgi:uncharacterized protein YeaO (DUF488 family)